MKKKIIGILFTLCMLLSPLSVRAAGSATIGFDGKSNASVGDTITLQMYVNNVSGTANNIGAVGIGGRLSFDSEYLEYVSSTPTTTPYLFYYVESSKKFAGVDNSMANGIKNKTTVLTLTFKAKKEGTTTVTVTEAEGNDSNNEELSVSVTPKTITIGKKPEVKDVTLSSLSVDGYSISPSFNANTTNYTLIVPNNVSNINVKAAAKDTTANVTGTGSKSLSVGKNTIAVKVTATDGTSKTYNIVVTRRQATTPVNPTTSSNDLSSLSVTGYPISPRFDKDTKEYTITVPDDVSSITINGDTVDSNATAVGLGKRTLEKGDNELEVTVKDKNGKENTYVIHVKRDSSHGGETVLQDATLKSLDVSGYTLTPQFNPKTNYYKMSVANTVTGLKVTAIPNDSEAEVEVSGNLGWKEGVNNITIKVTTPDGTTNMYIVSVTRAAANGTKPTLSSDNFLSGLVLGNGISFNEPFNKMQTNYSITVPYEVTSLDLKTITNSSKAKVKVIGNKNFEVGKVNSVEIIVTAEDGGVRYYTINVVRSSKSSGYDLKSLEVAGHTISPKFDKNITEYDLTVDGETDYLDVIVLAEDADAHIEITGNRKLETGKNVILVKVTDDNGFSKIYQINVTKEPVKTISILGMSLGQFLFWLFLLLLLLIFFLILLFRRKDKKEETPQTPIIEFKPEFNFGSKNTSDNDTVESGGTLNQNGAMGIPPVQPIEEVPLADYTETKEIPYDPYDEVVTKDELYDAIMTRDKEKLKMLIEQEALNRKKEEMRQREGNGE